MSGSKRIQAVLKHFPSDQVDVSPQTFAQWIGEFHSQEIRFVATPLPVGLFGCCFVFTASEEEFPTAMVVYNSKLSPVHQVHVQMHELAHLALGHPTWTGTSEDMEGLLHEPTRLIQLVREFSCRVTTRQLVDGTRSPQDQEAELLTRLIFQRGSIARRERQLKRMSSQADLDEALRRMGIE